MPVNTERKDFTLMKPKWERLRDCNGGRDAVLERGTQYVPNLSGLDAEDNKAYRARGNFYNATKRTVTGLTGAIFQKAPEVTFPENLTVLLDDITLANVTFEMFAVDAGREVMLIGRYGVLVDMPSVDNKQNRPYLAGYKAEDIINWTCERINGDDVLTMVVLRECVNIPKADDIFTLEDVEQYRVVRLKDGKCVQQLYRDSSDKSHVFEVFGDELPVLRRGESLTFIPFVFVGATHATPDLEDPPLIDLADVNLAHWRNSVDYEYGLHLVALPTPWVAGSKSGDTSGNMKMGPSVCWELEVNGSAGMLEFAGTGLASIVVAMDNKKKEMASLGARLLEEPIRGDTATATVIRHSGENASLRSVAGSVEQAFTLVLQIVAWWMGAQTTPADTEVAVELNKEYLDIKASAQEVQVALTALQSGEISFATWYNFIQTGGWTREGIDADAERKSIAEDATRKPVTEPVGGPPAV